MIQRLAKVTDGVYRGSAPTAIDLKWLQDNFGIKKVISLDLISGQKIRKACKLLGIKQELIPLTADKKSFVYLFRHNLKDLLLDGGPTYIHCYHGKDRTGLVAALFKIKYMGMSNIDALNEAKSFGFGIGVSKKFLDLYENLILNCEKSDGDENASIVDNQREYKSDNRGGILENVEPGSFAPHLDSSRTAPSGLYNPINDQSNTRQGNDNLDFNVDLSVPLVGLYNNEAGINGIGPTLNTGGFIYD